MGALMKGRPVRMIPSKFKSWLENLRFPFLLLLTGTLFVVDLLIPDAIPLVDELLLALVTILLARIKRKKPATATNDRSDPQPKE